MKSGSIFSETIQAMLNPEFYFEKPEKIELIQTQMSFIFIAGDFAYKLKKPVNLGYLDYTTLEKRRFYCERELELNQRLCPETYISVLAITQKNNTISFEKDGNIIDYVLKMRVLPRNQMLNVLLEKDLVSSEMMSRLAHKLSSFHQRAETGEVISTFGDITSITYNTEENFNQTEKSIGRTISERKYQRIREYTRRFLSENSPLFTSRVQAGKIRDCHGDLHAAHICFVNDICIYDCIEFNDRFRYGDIASEISFLAMDIDHYGRADISSDFVNYYVNYSGDTDLNRLLSFYKCYRAYVRGKVESFKLDDPVIIPEDKKIALRVAYGYFNLSSFYTRSRPTLIITVGVTGTGKTTLAKELAKHTGASVISSDIIRKQLAGIPVNQHVYDSFDEGIYSTDFTRKTYDTMLSWGRHSLETGKPVILDATFISHSDREKAREMAEEIGADFYILECCTNEEIIRERLIKRQRESSISDGRLEILGPQIKQFEPVKEMSEKARIIIDISNSLEMNIKHILDNMGEN
jgi:uncharacterized protein